TWNGAGGGRAKPADDRGSPGWKSQPPSGTGETPPYGMIGRVEETSASFEARSAPRSYPTPISGHMQCSKKRGYSIGSSARIRKSFADVYPDSLGSFEIDHELEFCGRLHGQLTCRAGRALRLNNG